MSRQCSPACIRRTLQFDSIRSRSCMRSSALAHLFTMLLLVSQPACILMAQSASKQQYSVALPGYRYEFPRDHFDHPDYQTEWWYYTGNVRSADGHRFGFELTFFRQGVAPNAIARDATQSTWHIHDVYMAHLALSDLGGRQFYHDERIHRAGPGIAGID